MQTRRRITSWILLLFLLGTVVPFAVNAFILGWTLITHAREELIRESETIGFMNARVIESLVADPRNALEALLDLTESEADATPAGIQTHYASLVRHYPIFSAIEVLDLSGTVLFSEPYDAHRIGFTRNGEDWFAKTSPDMPIYWSNTLRTDFTTDPSLTLVLRGTDRMIAALNDSMQNGMTVAVTDTYGIYIAHPDTERVKQGDFDPNFDTILSQLEDGAVTLQTPVRQEGELYQISARTIEGPGWVVLTYAPRHLTIEAVLQLLPASLGILIATLLLVLGFALLLLRRIRSSFRELESRTAHIASGQFDAHVGPQPFDEFNRLAGSVNTMTAALRDRDERLSDLAFHDKLTGLPNRADFAEHMRLLLASPPQDEQIALLFIDVDNFKSVNDSLGHMTGDKILMEVGTRLTAMLPPGCLAARMGGDEFLLLHRRACGEADLAGFASDLVDKLGAPYRLEGHSLWLGASIGVAVYPDAGQSFEELLRSADMAMYQAKAEGRKTFRICTPGMMQAQLSRFELARRLHDAVGKEELHLAYQPIIHLQDGSLSGFEALLRWTAPEGNIPPDQFIPIAEETGLIVSIGEQVLREACRTHAAWQQQGFGGFMSVNVSPLQLRAVDFADTLRGILKETGMRPELLSLEITESVLIEQPDDAIRLLEQLRDIGVHLSLDDFGTGYSSLNYLTRLPLDVLKIDRAFVARSMSGGTGTAMLRSILRMAHDMNLRTVAEGVETQEQVEYLRAHGCDDAQGWYYSKAVPSEVALRMVLEAPVENKPKEAYSK